jgi:hypothetical protein
MEVFSAATLAALVVKVTSVLKYLSAGKTREAITQLIPWLAGVVTVMVAAQANVSEGLVVFGELALGQLNVWSQILAGLALGSGGSLVYDFKKAVDNSDSAAEPPLLSDGPHEA